MIILFGGKEYAVGLTWFSISSPAEIDQFKHEMDMTRGVIKLSKEEGGSSCVALAPSEYANQVSLAAAISYAHDNIVYVCKTEYKDEAGRLLYYLCCVKRGTVTVEGDVLADVDTIQSLYAQSLMDLRTDIAEDHIECLGTDVDDSRFEGAQPIDVMQMVTAIQRFENQCVIKELKKEGPTKVKVGILAALALGTLFMGYLLFKPAPPPPPAPVAPVVRVPKAVDPFAQLLSSINMQSTVAPAALPMMQAVAEHIPMQISGWETTDITFNLGAVTTITVTLQRTPYATVDGLKALETNGIFKKVTIDPKGDLAKATWGVEIKDVPLLNATALAVLKGEKNTSFQQQFMTTLQSEAMKIDLDSPLNVGGYGVQKFKYKNVGLWSIGGFADVFHDMKTMGITSIHIQPDGGKYGWELQGVIYG